MILGPWKILTRYYRDFYSYMGRKLYAFAGLNLLVTLVEGLGITLFFPLLTGLSNGKPVGNSGKIDYVVETFFHWVGIPLTISTLLFTVLVVYFLKSVLKLVAGAYQGKFTADFMAQLSTRQNDAISRMSYRGFMNQNTGELSSAIVSETNRAMVSLSKFTNLCPPAITILVLGVLALEMDFRMAVFSFVFGSVGMLLLRYIARLAKRLSFENADLYAHLNAHIWEQLHAFKYLIATNRFPALSRRIKLTIERIRSVQVRLSAASVFVQSLNEPIAAVFLVWMIWQKTVLNGEPIASVLVLCLLYYRLMREIMNLISAWHDFSATMGSFDFCHNLVENLRSYQERSSGAEVSALHTSIRLSEASVAFGETRALTGLSLEIPRNKIIAVVGESGAGKTTAVDLITGIISPTTGKVTFDGLDYEEARLASIRARMGFVSQDPILFHDTIFNNICFWEADPASSAAQQKVWTAIERANASSFVKKLPNGIQTILGEKGVRLSGGQRQRIAIARELYRDPEILVLDEATSALDSESEHLIQENVEALRGKITIILIAHRFSTIRNVDLVYVLSHGKVVETGTFLELSQKPDSQFMKFARLQKID